MGNQENISSNESNPLNLDQEKNYKSRKIYFYERINFNANEYTKKKNEKTKSNHNSGKYSF